MDLVEAAEAALTAAQDKLDEAINANSHAILTQLETEAAVEAAKTERDRVQSALSALRGESAPKTDGPVVSTDGSGTPERKEAPTAKPKPRNDGPACPSCGKRGTLGPSLIEIKGKQIQVTACSNCSHQVW